MENSHENTYEKITRKKLTTNKILIFVIIIKQIHLFWVLDSGLIEYIIICNRMFRIWTNLLLYLLPLESFQLNKLNGSQLIFNTMNLYKVYVCACARARVCQQIYFWKIFYLHCVNLRFNFPWKNCIYYQMHNKWKLLLFDLCAHKMITLFNF